MNMQAKSEAEIIVEITTSLKDNALGDIRRAISGGAKIGAFLLCSCLLDAICGFRKGSDPINIDYCKLIDNELPQYCGSKLYTDLRCKLVHSYSEGGTYWFTDGAASRHISEYNGKIVVNLENFVDEIEDVLNQFLEEIKNNRKTRKNAIKRYRDNGVISVIRDIKDQQLSSLTPSLSGSAK